MRKVERQSLKTVELLLKPRGEVPFIGRERGPSRPPASGIAKYVSPHGSYRYVGYIDGEPVAAMQIVSTSRRLGTIAHVFVASSYRRRRLATSLLERAKQDFEEVRHAEEPSLSDDAKALIAGSRRRSRGT